MCVGVVDGWMEREREGWIGGCENLLCVVLFVFSLLLLLSTPRLKGYSAVCVSQSVYRMCE